METLFIGQNAIFLPEVQSTNSYAIELLKNVNLIDGTVVYTTHQTQGRGQRGNAWIGEPGLNLAVSIITKPTFLNSENIFHLYIISALSVHDLMAEILNSSQFDIKIKWPNDILVDTKKIAGILIENIINANGIQYSVAGIGINIHQTCFEDLLNATSLKLLTYSEYDIRYVLEKLCSNFEKYYFELKKGEYIQLKNQYYAHFYKLNETHIFNINGEEQALKVKGISNGGLLHLQNSDREDHYFDIKGIKW